MANITNVRHLRVIIVTYFLARGAGLQMSRTSSACLPPAALTASVEVTL